MRAVAAEGHRETGGDRARQRIGGRSVWRARPSRRVRRSEGPAAAAPFASDRSGPQPPIPQGQRTARAAAHPRDPAGPAGSAASAGTGQPPAFRRRRQCGCGCVRVSADNRRRLHSLDPGSAHAKSGTCGAGANPKAEVGSLHFLGPARKSASACSNRTGKTTESA
jgi:hypothetical protein